MGNIRQKALFIIDHVFYKGAFLEEELEILRQSKWEDRDFNFVRELATGVVRHRSYLDYVIKKKSTIKFKKIHKIILTILEMGIYQYYFMDKVPVHALVSESVELAKIYGNRGSVSFVNGMLRNIVKEKPMSVTVEQPMERLAIQYSHPDFYVKEIYDKYGEKFTEKLLKANNQQPKFTLRVNTLKTDREDLVRRLEEEGFHAHPGNLKDSLIVENPIGIFSSDSFMDGDFYVQDEASMKVSEIVDPKPEEKILDLCAAPGGKSTHMAAMMKDRGRIIACDISDYKLSLIRENCKRLGITSIVCKKNDGVLERKEFINAFDKVLIDAPCSAIGLYRRKPDIKWNRSLESLKELSHIQYQLLTRGASYVKIGGRLIYSTCSISELENEKILEAFLKNHPHYTLERIQGNQILKLFPHIDGTDGFSIFSLKRIR
ncbi:MAG: 16S rRNA (cytosine(967)-C(5))-methyltransferase RsmB [Tissierellia bacterium]|nr:16S rRNA (cytosine(967)-C(5))-methyltransferase RsmB [Tissierellia bacterium]